MRPLSPTYYEHLFWSLVKSESDDIKNLVFSSPEVSNAFGVFMRNILIQYGNYYTIFETDSREYCIRACEWVAPFVRKLLVRYSEDDARVLNFFEKVIVFNNLELLVFSYMNQERYQNEVLQKLMSVTRNLRISEIYVEQVPVFLERCETIVFTHADYDAKKLKPFAKNLDSDLESSIVLELFFDSAPLMKECIGALNKVKSQLQNVRNFYFVLEDVTKSVEIKKLIGCLSAFSPNIQNVFIGNCWFNNMKDYPQTMKDNFDLWKAAVRSVPQRIKVNMCVSMGISYHDYHSFSDFAFPPLVRVFLPEDFIITPGHKSRTITHRQTKLSENVEFLYLLEIKGKPF